MSDDARADPAPPGLLRIYDSTLPAVYGYLVRRCDSVAAAEDITSETFLAAADAVRRPNPPVIDASWLIGVARHKLADHWRRQARDRRRLAAIADAAVTGPRAQDPCPAALDRMSAEATLRTLAPHHRHVLSLRYLDDLPVADCAHLLGRSLHATEALLVRARVAFRQAYTQEGRTQ